MRRAMTTPSPTVVRLAMDLPCKAVSVRHVIAAMVKSGEKEVLVAAAAVMAMRAAEVRDTIDTSGEPYSTNSLLTPENHQDQ